MLCGLFGQANASGSSLRCTQCRSRHQAQAAAGIYGCTQIFSGRDGKGRQCRGTYEVKPGQADAVMEDFRRGQLEQRNAAVKAEERARNEAYKVQQKSSIDVSSKYMKPLPVTPLQVSPARSNATTKPRPSPRPQTLMVAVKPPTVRRRDATKRALPTQAIGMEWNHSTNGRREKPHAGKQASKATAFESESWYQPAPAKRAVVHTANESWYQCHPRR